MKTYNFFSDINSVYLLLLLILVISLPLNANVEVSRIAPSTAKPVAVREGESITFKFTLTNISKTTSSISLGVQNTAGGNSVPASNISNTSGNCRRPATGAALIPGAFNCDPISPGASSTYTFKTQPTIDTTVIEFKIYCINPDQSACSSIPTSLKFNIGVRQRSIGAPSFIASKKYSVKEDAGSVAVEIQRTGGADGILSANLYIGDPTDSAVEGVDYQLPEGITSGPISITWEDNDKEPKIVNIPIIDDNLFEGNEQISLKLNAYPEVGDFDAATITIVDDETTQNGVSPVDKIEIVSGDRQRFTIDQRFDDLVIKVLFNRDPIDGLPVEWDITQGTGKLGSATTLTDKDGLSSNSFFTNSTVKTVIRATVRVSKLIQATPKTSNRLQPRAESDDPFVEFIINPQISDTVGLSDNERSVAEALDIACPALVALLQEKGSLNDGQSDLLETCKGLQTADDKDIATSLKLLAPEEVITQGTAVIETGNLQVMNVNARLNALRSNTDPNTRFDVSSLGFNLYGQRVPQIVVAALFDNDQKGGSPGNGTILNGPWSGFINGEISIGNKDQTLNETGFSFNSSGLTAGLDFRISNSLVIGTAIGYGENTSDFDGAAGGLDMQSYHLTLYGTYYRTDQFYLDGLVRIGSSNYDTRRKVNSNLNQLILGDTDGTDQSISLNGGFEINKGAMTVGSYGRIGYTGATIDAYTETATSTGAGSGSILSIAKQDVDSLTTVLGGQLSYAISRRSGVYLPQLRLEWEHEYNDDSRPISAHFVHDPTTTQFTISTDSPDRDYFNLGLGFSAIGSHGRSGFLYYETRIDQDSVEQHWLKSGFRWEFN